MEFSEGEPEGEGAVTRSFNNLAAVPGEFHDGSFMKELREPIGIFA